MIGRPKSRILISQLYKKILGIIFQLPNVDFNGLILIKSEIIKNFNLSSTSNFISAEIILRSRKAKYNIDYENFFYLFPKNTYKSSSLNFKQLINVIYDMVKYFFK